MQANQWNPRNIRSAKYTLHENNTIYGRSRSNARGNACVNLKSATLMKIATYCHKIKINNACTQFHLCSQKGHACAGQLCYLHSSCMCSINSSLAYSTVGHMILFRHQHFCTWSRMYLNTRIHGCIWKKCICHFCKPSSFKHSLTYH